ncbi:MAG: ATP-binding protein, partial [Prevotellaceae bacterium]|nr:ATP-binding protein [Prevotellaceae bacterium]
KESNKKYYFIDNGILNLFLFEADTSLLENLVAVTLHRLYADQVYFINGKTEVDFFLPEQKTAIQVAYSLSGNDTREREIKGLTDIAKSSFDVKKYYIITKDEEELITEQGIEIQVIPVLKWLIFTNTDKLYEKIKI